MWIFISASKNVSPSPFLLKSWHHWQLCMSVCVDVLVFFLVSSSDSTYLPCFASSRPPSHLSLCFHPHRHKHTHTHGALKTSLYKHHMLRSQGVQTERDSICARCSFCVQFYSKSLRHWQCLLKCVCVCVCSLCTVGNCTVFQCFVFRGNLSLRLLLFNAPISACICACPCTRTYVDVCTQSFYTFGHCRRVEGG